MNTVIDLVAQTRHNEQQVSGPGLFMNINQQINEQNAKMIPNLFGAPDMEFQMTDMS